MVSAELCIIGVEASKDLVSIMHHTMYSTRRYCCHTATDTPRHSNQPGGTQYQTFDFWLQANYTVKCDAWMRNRRFKISPMKTNFMSESPLF